MPIWRIDRSRVATGHHCEQERQYQYYGGETGFGLVPIAQHLPLATGSLVHAICGDFLKAGMGGDISYIDKRLEQYRKLALKSGFISEDPDEEGPSKEAIVTEQSYLAAGIGLNFSRFILPDLLDRFDVLAVEEDIEVNLGEIAPDLTLIHDTKPDFIARRKSDGAIVSWDLKTESTIDKQYADKWRMSVQMGVQATGAARWSKERCDQYYILAIHKGARSREYNPDTREYDGPKRQNSLFCYGYMYDAGLGDIQYAPKYRYKDEAGKNRNLPKVWEKRALWDMPLEGKTITERMSYYLKQIDGKYNPFDTFLEVGPYDVPEVMVNRYFQTLAASELEWARGKAAGIGIVPSFECWNQWGKRCAYWDLCYGEKAGAELNFQTRRPHHKGELEEMKEAGVEVPDGWED